MPERFAVYFAPDPDGPLWRRAAQWLGRDARRSAPTDAIEIGGIRPERRRAVTESARRYGFHATLKPPFELAPGRSRADLLAAAEAFAAARAPVRIGRLEVAPLGDFLALQAAPQGDALTAFAADCVETFEPFRAPLAAAERARRLQAPLTPHQVDLLDRFGYPWVMDHFRFHMTLTDRLTDADAGAIAAAARGWFGPALDAPAELDRISVFHEPAPGAPFLRIADFALGAG